MSNIIWSEIWQGTADTLRMTLISTLLAYAVGLPFGVLLVVTDKGHILENKTINFIFGTLANILRSIPFLILLVVLMPFTRLIVGSSIGTTATIVPLTIGTIPIIARMVESSLKEVSAGIIEAARSMGASSWEIITLFMVPEAGPSLILGAAINLATILGYSAMAGCIGGGGLGAIALNYGYYRYQTDVLMITVIILILLIQIFQTLGTRIALKVRHS
ncbi:MAG: ABC transporter permease [Lachnospiraceae bacterium]|nr:ABC transporter permease [Lachnospiraceae bacterium]